MTVALAPGDKITSQPSWSIVPKKDCLIPQVTASAGAPWPTSVISCGIKMLNACLKRPAIAAHGETKYSIGKALNKFAREMNDD